MDHLPSLRPSPSLSTIRFAIPIPHLQWRAPRPPTPKKSSPRLNRDHPLLLPPVPPISTFAFAPDYPTPVTPSFLFPREPPPPPTKARIPQSQSLRRALSKRTHTRRHCRRSSSISEASMSSERTVTMPRPEKLGWEGVHSPMRLHFVEQDENLDSELVSLKSFMRQEVDEGSARESMMSSRLDENQRSRSRGRGWSFRERVRGVGGT